MEPPGRHHNSPLRALPAALLLSFVLYALFACSSSLAAAESPTQTAVSSDVETVVMLELDGEPLLDSFLVTERGGKVYVPVCALAEALSLALSCFEQRAFGFVLQEARPFLIDVEAGHVISAREVFRIDGAAFLQDGEIYVDSDALSRWLPIDFQLRQENSSLQMKAREPLPLQGFKKRQRFVMPRSAELPKQYPECTPARGAASVPVVDFASQLQVAVEEDSDRLSRVRNSLDLSADLFYMTGQAHLLAEGEALKRLDVTLSRRSTEGFHVGPVPLSQVAIGATQSPFVDGVGASSNPLYGVFLSNRPIYGGARFLSHDIHGYLPQGWDAELFHNGTQVGYQPPTEEGMYHFVNLRVYYGSNSFKVVLHGPFGERRESEEVFVSDATTPTGGLLYTFSAGWQTGLASGEDLEGVAHESNMTLTSDFGIGRNLTGSLSLVRLSDHSGEQQDYLGVGVRTAFRYTLLSLELIQSYSPGSGSDGQLLTLKSSSREVFGLNLELVQRFFREYYSPQFYYRDDPLRSWTSVKGNSSFTLLKQIRIPYAIELGVNTRRSGEVEAVSQLRVSGGWNGWNAVIQADVSRLQHTTYVRGVLQVSTRLRDISIRGEAGYAFAPTVSPSTVNLNADKELGNGFQLNSAISHDPLSKILGGRLGISKRMGLLGYSIAASGSSNGAYGFDVGIRSSIAADAPAGPVVVSAEPLSPYGIIAVSTKAAGADGILRPLPGIGFLLNGSRARTIPGSRGAAVIAFLQPDVPVDVTVDMATVEDPFMVSLEDGCRITPRAGVVSTCNFTMTSGGEIDGMVLVRLRHSGEVPIKGVRVDLMSELNGERKLQASTRSEESGYYLFKTVKPGKYRVVIPAAEIARLKAAASQPHEVTMPAGGDMVSGLDFVLERAAPVSGEVVGGTGPVLDQD